MTVSNASIKTSPNINSYQRLWLTSSLSSNFIFVPEYQDQNAGVHMYTSMFKFWTTSLTQVLSPLLRLRFKRFHLQVKRMWRESGLLVRRGFPSRTTIYIVLQCREWNPSMVEVRTLWEISYRFTLESKKKSDSYSIISYVPLVQVRIRLGNSYGFTMVSKNPPRRKVSCSSKYHENGSTTLWYSVSSAKYCSRSKLSPVGMSGTQFKGGLPCNHEQFIGTHQCNRKYWYSIDPPMRPCQLSSRAKTWDWNFSA